MASTTSSGFLVPGRWGLTAWLLSHTRELLPALGGAVIARVAGVLTHVAILVIAAHALIAASTGAAGSLTSLALIIIALSLLKATLRYLEHYAGHWVAFTALERLRVLFFARLIPRAPAATSGRYSAELAESATSDIDRIEVFFAHTFPPVIASVVVPSVALGWFSIVVNPMLAALIAVPLALALLLPFLSARMTWAASRAVAAERGNIATHVSDDVQGVREVLAFDAQASRTASLAALDDVLARSGARLARIIALRHVLERILWVLCVLALLLAGAPVAETVLALTLMLALWFGDAGTDDFATGLDAAFAACDRVYRIVEAPPVVGDRGSEVVVSDAAPSVEFEGVTFVYPSGRSPALDGVDLRFAAGEWHTIAGVSGSGKSTIGSLLMRTWDPDEGRILLDKTPLPDFSLDGLRSAVSVVDQRPIMFEGTVGTNLRLARPEASDEELKKALRTVCLDIDALPEGLDTQVGERGTTLSGGQLQRLALARSLVAGPRVLVLDEALSQLDGRTAAEVRERLSLELKSMTIIEITHRVDTISSQDYVAVIDRGHVVESGRSGELSRRSGAFSRLLLRDG